MKKFNTVENKFTNFLCSVPSKFSFWMGFFQQKVGRMVEQRDRRKEWNHKKVDRICKLYRLFGCLFRWAYKVGAESGANSSTAHKTWATKPPTRAFLQKNRSTNPTDFHSTRQEDGSLDRLAENPTDLTTPSVRPLSYQEIKKTDWQLHNHLSSNVSRRSSFIPRVVWPRVRRTSGNTVY